MCRILIIIFGVFSLFREEIMCEEISMQNITATNMTNVFSIDIISPFGGFNRYGFYRTTSKINNMNVFTQSASIGLVTLENTDFVIATTYSDYPNGKLVDSIQYYKIHPETAKRINVFTDSLLQSIKNNIFISASVASIIDMQKVIKYEIGYSEDKNPLTNCWFMIRVPTEYKNMSINTEIIFKGVDIAEYVTGRSESINNKTEYSKINQIDQKIIKDSREIMILIVDEHKLINQLPSFFIGVLGTPE